MPKTKEADLRDRICTWRYGDVIEYAASFDIEVTQRFIEACALDGRLRSKVIAKKRLFAKRDVRVWLEQWLSDADEAG